MILSSKSSSKHKEPCFSVLFISTMDFRDSFELCIETIKCHISEVRRDIKKSLDASIDLCLHNSHLVGADIIHQQRPEELRYQIDLQVPSFIFARDIIMSASSFLKFAWLHFPLLHHPRIILPRFKALDCFFYHCWEGRVFNS